MKPQDHIDISEMAQNLAEISSAFCKEAQPMPAVIATSAVLLTTALMGVLMGVIDTLEEIRDAIKGEK